MASNSSTASPRWRSSLAAGDLTAESRRTSNHSSTSSDILVASGHPRMSLPQIQPSHGYLQQTTPATSSMASVPTKFRVENGRHLLATFRDPAAKEKFRAILITERKPQLHTPTSTSTHNDSDDADGTDNEGELDTHGLDPLRTYSKTETLLYPHVKFVHRGQSRYRMASAIKNLSPAVAQRPIRYDNSSLLVKLRKLIVS